MLPLYIVTVYYYVYTPQRDVKQRDFEMEQLRQQYTDVRLHHDIKLLFIDPSPCMWSSVRIVFDEVQQLLAGQESPPD